MLYAMAGLNQESENGRKRQPAFKKSNAFSNPTPYFKCGQEKILLTPMKISNKINVLGYISEFDNFLSENTQYCDTEWNLCLKYNLECLIKLRAPWKRKW